MALVGLASSSGVVCNHAMCGIAKCVGVWLSQFWAKLDCTVFSFGAMSMGDRSGASGAHGSSSGERGVPEGRVRMPPPSAPGGARAVGGGAPSDVGGEVQIPDVASMMSRGSGARPRGRRSRLYMEAMADQRAEVGNAPPPKRTRAEVLAHARAVKAEKRAAVAQSAVEAGGGGSALPLAVPAAVLKGANVSKDALDVLRKGAAGAFPTYPLSDALRHAAWKVGTTGSFTMLVDKLCRFEHASMATQAMLSEEVGLAGPALRQGIERVASARLIADHVGFRTLVKDLASADLDLLLFLETASYDETPMPTRSREISIGIRQVANAITSGGEAAGDDEQSVAKVSVETEGIDVGPSKLFQVRSGLAMLLKAKHHLGDEDASYFIVLGRPLTWVQELQSTSAEVLAKALRDASCAPRESGAFRMVVRAATSDRLAANVKAEREVCRLRGEGWSSLRSPCDIHRVSTMQTSSLDHVSDLVSQMIHLSLSLRMGGLMKRFRARMRTVVDSRLKLLTGAPSGEAIEYRNRTLG